MLNYLLYLPVQFLTISLTCSHLGNTIQNLTEINNEIIQEIHIRACIGKMVLVKNIKEATHVLRDLGFSYKESTVAKYSIEPQCSPSKVAMRPWRQSPQIKLPNWNIRYGD